MQCALRSVSFLSGCNFSIGIFNWSAGESPAATSKKLARTRKLRHAKACLCC